jgi:hypothetical protein
MMVLIHAVAMKAIATYGELQLVKRTKAMVVGHWYSRPILQCLRPHQNMYGIESDSRRKWWSHYYKPSTNTHRLCCCTQIH